MLKLTVCMRPSLGVQSATSYTFPYMNVYLRMLYVLDISSGKQHYQAVINDWSCYDYTLFPRNPPSVRIHERALALVWLGRPCRRVIDRHPHTAATFP